MGWVSAPTFKRLAGIQIFILFAPEGMNAVVHNLWSHLLNCELCRNAAYDSASSSAERAGADDPEVVAALFIRLGAELGLTSWLGSMIDQILSRYCKYCLRVFHITGRC